MSAFKSNDKSDGGDKNESHLVFSAKALRLASNKHLMVHGLQSHQHSLDCRPWSIEENYKDLYAVLPPMDKYMETEKEDSENYIWDGFHRGDLVIVRISSIRELGFTALLLCMDGGKSRNASSLKIHVWCPIAEIPKRTNHEDVLMQFKDGDLVRCTILKVDSHNLELVVTLHNRSGCPFKSLIGKIEDDDLPLPYRRMLSSDESYENILEKSVGFINPSNVEYLLSRLKVPTGHEISLMDALCSRRIPESECADALRRRQSKNVADSSVKKGIQRFKNKEYQIALQDFNYALDMDTENVDALVARGALYANRVCFSKAIKDFEIALKLNPSHRNAREYLVEVLIQRAKHIESHIEDVEQVKEVKRCYQRALSLDHACEEARAALGQIEKDQMKSKENNSDSDEVEQPQEKYADTAKKLKSMLQNEVGMIKHTTSHSRTSKKHTRKRKNSATSSSSSESSSSTTSSSSSSSTSSSSSSSSSSSDDSGNNKRKRKHKCLSTSSSRSERSISHSSSNEKFKNGKHSQRELSQRKRSSTSKRLSYDGERERRKSASSQCDLKQFYSQNRSTRRRSDNSFKKQHTAVIQPSHDSIDRDGEKEQLRSAKTDIKIITKDNFKDILNEISKFESSSKSHS